MYVTEHKNDGPAWTRRLWRPALYHLSYDPVVLDSEHRIGHPLPTNRFCLH